MYTASPRSSFSSLSCLSLVPSSLAMAVFRPTMTSKRVILTNPTHKAVSCPQCNGITRRGARCRRSATASNLPGQSGKANLGNYCKTHLRINLNSGAKIILGRAARKSSYKGPSRRAICLFYFSFLLAHVPPYVGTHACKCICDALRKGPSSADEPGAIYAYEVHGKCPITTSS